MKTIIAKVQKEMDDQDAKWGIQDHNAVEWIAILTEEVGEASKVAVDFHFGNGSIDPKMRAGESIQRQRISDFKRELTQVAAVAIQAIASIERQAF